ncbi:hypothetical protein [Actinoplanes sp. M2I2]|uniref:DUF7711 family protein n=1 Tax=Actinoplanes sp. M2I2 TaxID=1734444 RepID=UPI0020222D45|nr:hypothetical protein [Actinoplanes sp. M2I2]
MRYEKAVRRLRTIADSCQRAVAYPGQEPVLVAAYTFGPIFDGPDEVDVVRVAFALDLPAEEVPWGTTPPVSVGLVALLGLDKAPALRCWRSARRPVADSMVDRPLRIWSLDGPDSAALDALARRDAEHLRLLPLTDDEQRQRLAEDLAISLRHLRQVRDRYADRDWRSDHRGHGVYPENHLWDAVDGYLELLDLGQQ